MCKTTFLSYFWFMVLAGFFNSRLRSCLLAGFCCLVQLAIHGQQDTILQLHEIEVTAHRIDLSDIGKHTDAVDSQSMTIFQHDNLASILIRQTPLFVRSYGSGTLATLGIRGGNASHTQLMWNGIPLRNPMIGLVDLSLIPSFFIDAAAVHYGGHGAAFGSGAVGGLISLSNKLIPDRNDVSLHLGAGSWDRRIGELKANYGFKKFRFSTRLFSQFEENNYRYKLSKRIPERNQVHHQLKSFGWLQEIYWTRNEKERITARLWYQNADRQIPPTSTQTTSKSAQQDKNLRVSLQWMRTTRHVKWQIKTAWLDETIDFQDSLILLYTQNQFRTWIGEGETSFRLAPGLNFTGGLYTERVQASSANYLAGTSSHQHAAFTSMHLIKNDWLWRIQMREEVTNADWSPLLIDVSSEWSGIKRITIKSSFSRNYRTPTLNDLSWRPGGNPDLKPEKGWTFEAGLHFSTEANQSLIQSSVTAYTRTMDQWIMWMPPVKDVSNYWSPINISEVLSKGIEARFHYSLEADKWLIDFIAGLDLTWSTFGEALPDFKIKKGDQLFYVPVENFITGFEFGKGDLAGFYRHRWYGDSPGINDDIEAGHVGWAGISLNFHRPNLEGRLYLQAENVWNVPYRIIERRPMPGRSWTGGIKVAVF